MNPTEPTIESTVRIRQNRQNRKSKQKCFEYGMCKWVFTFFSDVHVPSQSNCSPFILPHYVFRFVSTRSHAAACSCRCIRWNLVDFVFTKTTKVLGFPDFITSIDPQQSVQHTNNKPIRNMPEQVTQKTRIPACHTRPIPASTAQRRRSAPRRHGSCRNDPPVHTSIIIEILSLLYIHHSPCAPPPTRAAPQGRNEEQPKWLPFAPTLATCTAGHPRQLAETLQEVHF